MPDILRHARVRHVLAVLAALTLLLLAIYEAANRAPGRWLAESMLAGTEIGTLGQLEIGGLSGRLLRNPSVDMVHLRDEQGVWATLEGIELNWDGLALVTGQLDIETISIDRIEVRRQPVASPVEPSADSGLAVRIGAISAPQILLAEPVFGHAVELEAAAGVTIADGSVRAVSLQASGRSGAPDQLTIMLERAPSGALVGEIDLTAPPGGVLMRVLNSPGLALQIAGRIEGGLDDGTGQAVLTLDDVRAATVDIRWTDQSWRVTGELVPAALALADWIGTAPVQLTSTGAVDSLRPESLQLQAADLALALTRREDGFYQTGLTVDPARYLTALELPLGLAAAQIDGVVDLGARSFAGEIRLDEVVVVDVANASQLSGPLGIVLADTGWSFDLAFTAAGLVAPTGTLQRVLGTSPALAVTGRWSALEGHYEVSSLLLDLEAGQVRARGTVIPESLRSELSGEIALADVSAMVDTFQGPAAAQFTLETAGLDAVYLSARTDVSQTSLPDMAKAILADLALTVRSNETIESGYLLDLETQNLVVTAEAVPDPEDGGWGLSGNAQLSASNAMGGVTIGTVQAGFDVALGAEGVRLRSDVSTPSLALQPVSFEAPRLVSEIDLNGTGFQGGWQFEAQSEYGAVLLRGDVRQDPNAGLAVELAGLVGAVTVEGAGGLQDQGLTARLNLSQTQEESRWSLIADVSDAAMDLSAGEVGLELSADNILWSGIEADQLRLRARGTLDRLAVSGTASGRYDESFDLVIEGGASFASPSQGVSLAFTGDWGGAPVRSFEPLEITREAGVITANADIALGPARFRTGVTTVDGALSVEAQASAVPAQWLTDFAALPDWAGLIDLQADLVVDQAQLSGEAFARASGLQPMGTDGVDPMDLTANLRVGPEVQIEAQLNSTQMSGHAALVYGGPALIDALSDLFSLSTWTGELRFDGEAGPLAALALPEGEEASGRFDITMIHDAGSRAGWEGRVQINEASFTSASSGIELFDISLDATVDADTIQLVSVSAHDGLSGRLSGEGRAQWLGETPTGILTARFETMRLVNRPDASVTGTGHVDFSLSDAELLISGQADILRARFTPPGGTGAAIPEIEVEEINRDADAEPANRTLPIRLEYQITAGDDVFIDSRTFNTEWSADLTASGDLNALGLTGRASLISGQAFLLNRPFRFLSGEVVFDGAPRGAGISLSAVHQRQGFEATIDVGGTISSPTVSLSSDPDLPQDEIFSRLLFDRSSSSLSTLEAAQLAAQLSGRSLLSMVSRLRDATGVDRLDVASGQDGGIVVTGGRRIGERFYVEVETGTADALSAARIEWDLTPAISILSRLSGDTEASVSVRWRTEYD